MASSAILHSPKLHKTRAATSFVKRSEATPIITSDFPLCASVFKENKLKPRPHTPPVPPEGGYDDEIFLSPPPKDLQCIICFLTVREPHLITCCGAIICKLCMMRCDAESECPHCRDTSSHLVVPDKRTKGQTMSLKVKCTNGDCEWRGELIDYNNHITEKCPNRVVQCQYGCGLYFIASEVSVHEEEECTKRPYEVVVQYYEVQLAALQRRQEEQMNLLREKYGGEIQSLQAQIHSLKEEKVQAETTRDLELKNSREKIFKLENKQTTYNYVTREFPSWYGPSAATNLHYIPPCIRAMTNFTTHKLNGDSWYSPPIYTGPGGYKLQLRVDVDGSSTAKGTHVSVCVYLMKGEDDDCLGWPFKGSIHVKLLNWAEDKNHLEHSFSTTSDADPQSFSRVIDGVRAPGEMYQRQFIAHKELEFSSEKKTQYMMEDVLCFVISSVEVLSKYQLDLVPEWTYPVLSTLQYDTLPVYRTIKDFRTNKQNNAVLYTDPFYTTKGGYKVTLGVYPNGYGSGEGTHISAFIHLMKGKHDHNLPFPFSGIFTIKLLNWEQDTGHVEKTVAFDEAISVECRERVTTTERGRGAGYDILSHSKLEENSDQQYVYQDMLCFQILFELIQQTGSPVPSWCVDVMSGKSATPPCTRTLYSYTAYKRTNRGWGSPAFYTGDKGYKLGLVVWPHGDVSIDLLSGEHDDSLKWPLTADITLQLLNWRGDNNHLEWTFHHDEAPVEACKRVTQGIIAPAHLGHCSGFITDSVIHRVGTDTEYLRDDNLCFKILCVKVV